MLVGVTLGSMVVSPLPPVNAAARYPHRAYELSCTPPRSPSPTQSLRPGSGHIPILGKEQEYILTEPTSSNCCTPGKEIQRVHKCGQWCE